MRRGRLLSRRTGLVEDPKNARVRCNKMIPGWEQSACDLNGNILYRLVRVIAKRPLRAFWERFPDAEGPLLAWFREVEKEHWGSPADVKRKYRHASIVGDRVVFNIKGNNYRLVVRINYELEVVYVRFVGTHEQYDEIDVREV